jgi:thymidylate synthase (FAD)
MAVFVKLLSHTADGEKIAAIAGKLCYSSGGYDKITGTLTDETIASFINKINDLGHYSVLEHMSFSFIIEGVSRALTHQLVRHRIASYSQQSQRYVNESGFDYITPHTIEDKPELKKQFDSMMDSINTFYKSMTDAGIPKEDARYALPNAAETKIVVTMNARELLHFFEKRCCNRAQWEIHEMSDLMLAEAKIAAPLIFKNAGPGCVGGPCPEGKMTCGKITEVRKKYNSDNKG